MQQLPDATGHFGQFGGRYVPETLMPALLELEDAYNTLKDNADFNEEFRYYLREYVGRPNPLYYAERLTETLGGAKIYLKREDLNHTGAHKINSAIGQILLARWMGKKRIIAETGAGQHGVATATVAAKFDMECEVYMGEEDIERQALNVFPDAADGHKSRACELRFPYPQRCDQRLFPRLGHKRPHHLHAARFGRRRASLPDDRSRLPSRHR